MTDVPDDDDLDPEEAEARITRFIEEAERHPGPPVAELAEGVADLVRAAAEQVAALVGSQPHDKVVATFLLLGRRARGTDPAEPQHWWLHAASTLMSPLLVPAAGEGAGERTRTSTSFDTGT